MSNIDRIPIKDAPRLMEAVIQEMQVQMETGHWPPGNQPEYGPVFGLTAAKRGELARRIAPGVASRLRRKLLN